MAGIVGRAVVLVSAATQQIPGQIARAFSGLTKALANPLTLATAAVPLLSAALQGAAAYAAGLVAILGAIGPALAAVGGAAASAFTLFAGVLGVTLAALKTDSEMLTRFQEAARGLGSEFKRVGLAAQTTLLPALTSALATATDAIPTLEVFAERMGAGIGAAAERMSELVLSSDWTLEAIDNLGVSGSQQIATLGNTIGNLIATVLHLADAASPVFTRFLGWLDQVVLGWRDWYRTGNDVTAWFTAAGDRMAQVWRILSDVFGGVFNVMKAGAPVGAQLLDGIERMMARFSEFTGSLEGQQTLRLWFEDSLPMIREVNALLGTVTGSLMAFMFDGGKSTSLDIFATLRTDLLPAISEMLGAMQESGPSVVSAITSVSSALSSLAETGVIQQWMAIWADLLGAISTLLSYPIVAQIVAWTAVLTPFLLGIGKIVGAFMAFGGLFASGGSLAFVTTFITATLWPAIMTAFTAIAGVITGTVLPALGALWAALMANPVVLIIAAVVALVAALILAYKKSETFRNIVDTVGRTIRDVLVAAFDKLKAAWEAVWPVLQAGWEGLLALGRKLWDGLQAVWDGIKAGFDLFTTIFTGGDVAGKFGTFIDTITQPLQGLVQIFRGAWEMISGIFTGDWDKFTDGIANVIGGVVRLFLGMPSRIIQAVLPLLGQLLNWLLGLWASLGAAVLSGITTVIEFFKELPAKAMAAYIAFALWFRNWALGLWDSARSAFLEGVDRVVTFATELPGRIMDGLIGLAVSLATWASDAWTSAKSNTEARANELVEWVKGLPERIINGVSSLATLVAAWAVNTWNTAKTNFTTGINATIALVKALPDKAYTAIVSLIQRYAAWGASVWIGVREAFNNGINTAVALVKALPSKALNALGNLKDRLFSAGRDLVEGFKRGLNSAVDGIVRAAKDLAGKVVGAIKSALGIASPSKVAYGLGGYTGEGFEGGLADRIKSAALTAQKYAAAVADAMRTDLSLDRIFEDGSVLKAGQARGTVTAADVRAGGAFFGSGAGQAVTVNQTINAPQNMSAEQVAKASFDRAGYALSSYTNTPKSSVAARLAGTDS